MSYNYAGLADADGSETGTGGIRIYLSIEERARALQLVLTACGVRSSVNLVQRAGTFTNKGMRKKDLWYLQITDCTEIPCHRLDVSGGHVSRFKAKYQTVRSVDALPHTADVYCFNEPKRHKAVFGNLLTFQCNLTEVVIRADDSEESIANKVRLATILGTIQASFTSFRYLSKQWKTNCEEEALLGVSLDGVQDCDLTSFRADPDELAVRLDYLNHIADSTNAEWADRLGINRSAARTCSKPSGNSSQLVNCASGMHPRYGRFVIRRTRGNKSDPVSQVVMMSGVHTEDEVRHADSTSVHSWAQAAPENAITRHDMTALDQLERWLIYVEHWTDHNPSITIYVRDEEWMEVGAFVFKHFNRMCGVTFLPFSDHIYRQAPYEEITETQYLKYLAENPDEIQWDLLGDLESRDLTDGAKELACTSGACSV